MSLDRAYQEMLAQKVKVVGKVKAELDWTMALMVLFFWLKANGTLTISWWWMLLALLA